MTKHKHDAYIRGWLDGKAVQFYSPSAMAWIDMPRLRPDNTIFFNPEYDYRIKPDVLEFRAAIMADGRTFWVVAVNSRDDEQEQEAHPNFHRWAGDWVSIKVGP